MQRLLGNCEVKNAFPFFGIASRSQLGPFEQQVLEALWSRGNATVRELLEDRKITQAYTTVMTIMDRLHHKGFLTRKIQGRTHLYEPVIPYTEVRAEAVNRLIDSFFDGSPEKLRLFLSGNSNEPSPADAAAQTPSPATLDEALL